MDETGRNSLGSSRVTRCTDPLSRSSSFMRAINVGGRRLTNDELMQPFRRLGLSDVAAYQTSGNITFRSGEPESVVLERIHQATTEAYGFETSVFLRSHVELTAITDTAPFSDEALAGTEGRIQVCFLRTAPPQETVAEVLAKVPVGERLAFEGREWFWLPKRGISDSRLPVSMIEALVGPMTMRTLGTVQRMLRTFG